MSSKTPNPDKGIDLPTHADHIGRDGEGYQHYFSGYENTIYVYQGQKRVHVREFDDFTGLPLWIAEIAKRKGWEEFRYSDGSAADSLTKILEEAVES